MKLTKYIRCFSQQRLGKMILLLALCTLPRSVFAIEVIAHVSVATKTQVINITRAMFGMRQTSWADGTPVRVFVLPDKHPLHGEFCKEILNIYPYQLRQSWDRLIYSGTGQAPTEVLSEEEMLARVSSTPGAIGYVRKVNGNAPSVHLIAIY